jgi:hypothetical protein
VTHCRCSLEETAFSTTTISLIGVLPSSNGVSEISAFGTTTIVTMTRRKAVTSRVSLAWWRNINFIPVVAEEAYDGEKEAGREAAFTV